MAKPALATKDQVWARVAVIGKEVADFVSDAPATVNDALAATGYSHQVGYDIRVNGKPAGVEKLLQTGDIVTVVPKIRAGI